MIEARAAGKETEAAPVKAPRHDNVVNLMDVLQKSLEASKNKDRATPARSAQKASAEKPKKTAKRKTSAA
jgi:non-homologous end joining protein Ku